MDSTARWTIRRLGQKILGAAEAGAIFARHTKMAQHISMSAKAVATGEGMVIYHGRAGLSYLSGERHGSKLRVARPEVEGRGMACAILPTRDRYTA